jgi:triosephosphate isomerase
MPWRAPSWAPPGVPASPRLLCIGETLAERDRQETQSVISRQLTRALEGAPTRATLLVAYEPVWAIGTGVVATTEQVAEAHDWVGEELSRLGRSGTPVLYGGSVDPKTAAPLAQLKEVDGFLVGGASLDAPVLPRYSQGVSRGGRARARLTPSGARGSLVGHTRSRTSRRSSCRAF